MDIDKIKKLLAKALLEEISEEERGCLDEWLQASEENSVFFEHLKSKEYLERAVGDHNQALRDARWKKLERKTVGLKHREIRFRVLRIVAAVVIPLVVGGMAWLVLNTGPKGLDVQVADASIKVGSSKAVVVLSNGEKISLFGDTTLCRNDGLALMVNQKDTLNFMRNNDQVMADNSYNVIQIPRGGEYIVRLEDGTTVYLNSESELRIPVHFGKNERTVWLTGEAYFSVRHDENRVFTVRTPKADVSVLGTEFAVRAYGEENEVLTTLVTGAVEIKSENDVHRIVPGEQAKVTNGGKIDVTNVEVGQYIAWKLGRIIFKDARLEDVLDELQRWYDFTLFYENPVVKDYRFTMDIMKYQDVSEIFELMEKTRKVKFSVKGRNVVISEK